jgi:hypothetical protein
VISKIIFQLIENPYYLTQLSSASHPHPFPRIFFYTRSPLSQGKGSMTHPIALNGAPLSPKHLPFSIWLLVSQTHTKHPASVLGVYS